MDEFSAVTFDQFLAEHSVHPTHVFIHPRWKKIMHSFFHHSHAFLLANNPFQSHKVLQKGK